MQRPPDRGRLVVRDERPPARTSRRADAQLGLGCGIVAFGLADAELQGEQHGRLGPEPHQPQRGRRHTRLVGIAEVDDAVQAERGGSQIGGKEGAR
jgi:hypothetical protein